MEYDKSDNFEYRIIDQTGSELINLGSKQVSGQLNQVFSINLTSGKYYLVISNRNGKNILPFTVVK